MHRFVLGLALIASLLLAACASPTATTAPANGEGASSGALSGKISITGSTTVQPLAEKMGEEFMAKNPGVVVEVTGGGSSVGVKAAAQGTADIGNASREVKQEELDEFPNLKVHVIARDGIAIVVHPDTAVGGLTVEQVRDIFSGKITSWSEVGGPDALIIVASREEGSGTRDAFQEMVMGDALITENAILQQSNGALRTTVANTPNAIAYLSFGYLDESVKVLPLDGVEATEENASNGSYPVVRPLNMLTNGEPQGLVKAFLDFVLGPEGQAIVRAEGYIPVR